MSTSLPSPSEDLPPIPAPVPPSVLIALRTARREADARALHAATAKAVVAFNEGIEKDKIVFTRDPVGVPVYEVVVEHRAHYAVAVFNALVVVTEGADGWRVRIRIKETGYEGDEMTVYCVEVLDPEVTDPERIRMFQMLHNESP